MIAPPGCPQTMASVPAQGMIAVKSMSPLGIDVFAIRSQVDCEVCGTCSLNEDIEEIGWVTKNGLKEPSVPVFVCAFVRLLSGTLDDVGCWQSGPEFLIEAFA